MTTKVFNTTNADISGGAATTDDVLKAGLGQATTFKVDLEDLVAGGSVLGSSGKDTLSIVDTSFDLRSTTISSVEVLKAGSASATTFNLDQTAVQDGKGKWSASGVSDLTGVSSIVGSSGTDTLVGTDALVLTGTTLSSIEILKTENGSGGVFVVDQGDLAKSGSVLGGAGDDTIAVNNSVSLTGTTLSSIEILQMQGDAAATLTVDQADLLSDGSVVGASKNDSLAVKDTTVDLTSTTLSSVEILKAGSAGATSFKIDDADVAGLASILGSSGMDSLVIAGVTSVDLSSTTLSSVEILKAGTTDATTFLIDAKDLAANGSVLGTAQDDVLQAATSLDLSATTLSSIETLEVATTENTTFTVDAKDLAVGGSVLGNSGTDTLATKGSELDVSSTTLSSVEILKGTTTGVTFKVDEADFDSLNSIVGGKGNDTLMLLATTDADLSSVTLSSVETLKATLTSDTTFTVDQEDLSKSGSITGSSGNDTVSAAGTSLSLGGTTLSSVEIIQAGTADDTTLSVDTKDLASGGSVLGGGGSDSLAAAGSSLDLTSTTLSNIEFLKSGTNTSTTFTVDAADLESGLPVVGTTTGKDTLIVQGTSFDLTATTLSSIEILKSGSSSATIFEVDQDDLASGGSIVGSTGNDTLLVQGTEIDLSSTTMKSVETIQASSGSGTTFKVDTNDLASGGSILGDGGNDTLTVGGVKVDLSSTTLSSIESLEAGSTSATTFTVDSGDLAGGLPITGVAGANDTLIVKDTSFDLTSTDLSSIEILKAGSVKGTTITLDVDDLADGGSIIGSSGADTLIVADTAFDLTSVTLSNIEILKAATTEATTFTVDATDLAKSGSVLGSTHSIDKIVSSETQINLGSTTLSSVEVIQAGSASDTRILVDSKDLVSGSSVIGGAGTDTLAAATTSLDVSSTTLTDIEFLKAGLATATSFTLTAAQLDGLPVHGSSGKDTVILVGTEFDLTSATLSSIEILRADSGNGTTGTLFTVDQADLATGGSVIGSTSSTDTLVVTGTSVNLSSSTLTSVEKIKAETDDDTTFTLDTNDLAKGGSILGGAGIDSLVVGGSAVDLSSTTLSGVEILKSTSTSGATITVDANDLAGGVSVEGGTGGKDTLAFKGTDFDLTSTTLSNVEILKAGVAGATRFTVDQEDLSSGGSIIGSSANDTLLVQGTTIDLTSTALSSVEILKAATTDATTFVVDVNDLAKGGSVLGNTGAQDTLQASGTALDLSATTLSSIEVLQGGAAGTTFTVDAADLTGGVEVRGDTSAFDTLVAKGTSLDLTSTTLSSVDVIKAGSASPSTLTVDVDDLAAGGSVLGSTGKDTLIFAGTEVDLTSTTLSSIEVIKASTTEATTFTVDKADLAKGGFVTAGTSAVDKLVVLGDTVDLSSTTLTSVEIIQGNATSATTFVLDTNDMASGGSVDGTAQNDVLKSGGSSLDLSSTTLSSIESLQAASTVATTFTIDGNELTDGPSISGNSGKDTLAFRGAGFDLSSTTVSSIEILRAGLTTATTFTVDAGDLASGGSVFGSTGVDTLIITGTAFNVASTGLSSVEILKTVDAGDTTFTVDARDLAAGGSVLGSDGADTLKVVGSTIDLSSTTLSGVETLLAGTTSATTFTLDTADLAGGLTVKAGTSASDTLVAVGTALNLTSTTLESIDVLKAGNVAATTFTIDSADLVSGGSVLGNTSKSDKLVVADTAIDLTSTALSSVEILQAGLTDATIFKVNAADLAANGSIVGGTSEDTLIVQGTSFDLLKTTLTGIELLVAGSTSATTFLLDTNDLAAGGSINGDSGNDIIAGGSELDLSSTTLSSIEALKSGVATGTTFTIDDDELLAGLPVTGSTGRDTLAFRGTEFDLTSTTISSIEVLKAATTLSTVFTVDAGDLVSSGSVVGGGGAGSDALILQGTSFDLTSTGLSSIEKLQASGDDATTFTVDANDLAAGGSVVGGAATDALVAAGTILDLSNTTLSGIEDVKAGSSKATTITIDANETDVSLTIYGSTSTSAGDTLAFKGTDFDLTLTSLSSIEVLKAATTSGTTFTVDQDDLIASGSVLGNTGSDRLVILGGVADLGSTTLSSVEILAAKDANVAFNVNQADLIAGGSVLGTTGTDSLGTLDTQIDLSSTTLSGVEVVAAIQTSATIFTVDAADLSGVEVQGNSANDTLAIKGTSLDLSSTSLVSVEILKAGVSQATTFTVADSDLASIGGPIQSVVGSSGSDTLLVRSTDVNLTAVTLSSVEIIKTNATASTTFALDQADLAAGGSIIGVAGTGTSGTDTLDFTGTDINLSSTMLSSIEIVQAGAALPLTFTVNQADLASLKSIVGNSDYDTLVSMDTSFNLLSTSLTSIDILKAGNKSATTFSINALDLEASGSVLGSTGNDTLKTFDSFLDLSATTLSSVEILQGSFSPAVFTVDAADLAAGGSVLGVSGPDILEVRDTIVDLTSTTLSSVETLRSSEDSDTFFTINHGEVGFGGTIEGGLGSDTLTIVGTQFDVSSVTLSSIEFLQAGSTNATTFKIDTADVFEDAKVIGSTSAIDTVQTQSTELDLSSTTLSSIEKLVVGTANSTTFTVNADDLASKGSVIGSSGTDSLVIVDTAFDLTSTTLSNLEILKAGNDQTTVFTVDQIDLATKGSVFGGVALDDKLTILGTDFDLSSTTLSDVEILEAAGTVATTFTVNQSDLAADGVVSGTSKNDILASKNSNFDLTSTTLTSVEVIKSVSGTAGTLTVDMTDLADGGSVLGNAATNVIDSLAIAGTELDLTSTTLSSIERLVAGTTDATTFIVNQADLATNGSVLGSGEIDKLHIVGGTTFDLSATRLSSIELLQGGTSATTFTLNQADLASGGSVVGDADIDKLLAADSALNLTSTTLDFIEILAAAGTTATTITVDATDLFAGGSVLGGTGADTLAGAGGALDLTATTLSSVERLSAGSASATLFTVDAADLAAGGSVLGSTGSDTLVIFGGTTVDLTSTALSSVEILEADIGLPTTFIVQQADLASGGSVYGEADIDTLKTVDTLLTLTSTTLSSIDILQAGSTSATTFRVDQSDLFADGSVLGNSGSDTLEAFGGLLDLRSITLSSVEILTAGTNSVTKFIVDGDGAGVLITGSTSAADTFEFVSGYALDDLSSSTTILADVATITNFSVTGAEIIDIDALVQGTATFQAQATTQAAVDGASPATLLDALDAAGAAIDGSTNSVVTAFQFGGATYVLVDNSGTSGLTTGDVVIKLSGALSLTTSEFDFS